MRIKYKNFLDKKQTMTYLIDLTRAIVYIKVPEKLFI